MAAEYVSQHFLEFAIHFLAFAKNQYQEENTIKAGSLAFHTLVTLHSISKQDLTMSELAQEMMITKQQLTRLINDLEEKALVQRIHNPSNRRQEYIRITPQGSELLTNLKREMLETTASALSVFTESERTELDQCVTRLTELLSKMDGFY